MKARFGVGIALGMLLATAVNGVAIAQTTPAPVPSAPVPSAPAPSVPVPAVPVPSAPVPNVPVAPPAVESPFDLPKSIPTVSPDAVPVTPKSPEKPEVKPVEDPIRLVVQRGKRRVMVYRGQTVLAKYPLAVGKKGWETPIGTFKVLTKEKDPIFKSFKTGAIIQPGPDNPLGPRWIGIWTDGKTQLGFHGTDQPELIGKAVSHGCLRMHNKDAIALYDYVRLGTEVVVEK